MRCALISPLLQYTSFYTALIHFYNTHIILHYTDTLLQYTQSRSSKNIIICKPGVLFDGVTLFCLVIVGVVTLFRLVIVGVVFDGVTLFCLLIVDGVTLFFLVIFDGVTLFCFVLFCVLQTASLKPQTQIVG